MDNKNFNLPENKSKSNELSEMLFSDYDFDKLYDIIKLEDITITKQEFIEFMKNNFQNINEKDLEMVAGGKSNNRILSALLSGLMGLTSVGAVPNNTSDFNDSLPENGYSFQENRKRKEEEKSRMRKIIDTAKRHPVVSGVGGLGFLGALVWSLNRINKPRYKLTAKEQHDLDEVLQNYQPGEEEQSLLSNFSNLSGSEIDTTIIPSNANLLHYAASKGFFKLVKTLVDHDADVNQALTDGATPLFIAAQEGHKSVVEYLVKHGANVNQANNLGWTPLYNAVVNGEVEIVRALLAAKGIDVNKADKDGRTPLYTAVDSGDVEIVRALLAANDIDVNKADKDGWTPLYRAVVSEKVEIVRALLAAKDIDVNKADIDGWTPLKVAKRKNYSDIVEILGDHGAQ